MRYFALLNFQHIMLFVFPTLIFMLVFGAALAYSHWHGKDSDARKKEVYYEFPDGIEDRRAPFPLALVLIIAGTALWAFFYTLGIGVWGVKI